LALNNQKEAPPIIKPIIKPNEKEYAILMNSDFGSITKNEIPPKNIKINEANNKIQRNF